MPIEQVSIYIDENAMDTDLVAALRSRDVTVITVLEVGLFEKSDDEQLAYATKQGCAIYTFNVGDFFQIHTQWAEIGREHAGMILAPQQRYSIGEQLRRILHLRAAMTAADMRNKAEFLANWG